MFSTAYEICKLKKKNHQNETVDWIKFEFQQKMNRRGYTVGALGWTVRGDVLAAFIDDYTESMDFWSLQATSDTGMKARLQGVKDIMTTFQFLFSGSLGKIIFRIQ